jgi:hypothetical protein
MIASGTEVAQRSVSKGPPGYCELNDRLQCRICDRKYPHQLVKWICKKAPPPKPKRKTTPEGILAREAICSGCEFYVLGEWGASVPMCSLLECPHCTQNLPPEKKAILRTKKWRDHLANAEASCLLPTKKKWGPDQERAARA